MRPNSFTLLAAAGLGLSFANGAVAADMPLKARPMVPVVAPLYSWTGFYVGANFGGAWSNSSFTNANTGLDWTPGSSGFIGGLQGGYNYQMGNLVLGVEADFDWASFDRSTQFSIPSAGVVRASADTNWISTVAARVGYGWDRWLAYAKIGGGWAHNNASVTFPSGAGWSGSNTNSGWLLGGGIEYAFADSWTVKLEYDYLALRDWTASSGPTLVTVNRDIQMIKAGINYRIGYAAPSAPAARPSGGHSTEELAKASQNPIASLISVPFQNNTNFNTGPYNRTQNILNIQPVIPMALNSEWNVISRTIVPVMSQPNPIFDTSTWGVGDITQSLFFAPTNPGELIWGVGPVFTAPAASDRILGTGKLLFGPTAVALVMPGHWVIGALVNNQWSVAGDPLRKDVNAFFAQPFVNYNLADGWFLNFSPIITADWLASSSQRWSVPVGGGFGRVFRVGDQPINASLSAYYNVVRPDAAGNWQLRAQVALLFPK